MRTILATLLLLMLTAAHAAKRDLDVERLRASLHELAVDPTLGPFAQGERTRAEAALVDLEKAGTSNKKIRTHLLYIAERRIDIAYAAAQAEDLQRKLQQLDREHDQILVEASRHEAEQARLELERQRLQSMMREEESERLRSEAEAARELSAQDADSARQEAAQAKRLADAQSKENELARKEAQLAEASLKSRLANLGATQGPRGPQMILEDFTFSPGASGLKPEAKGHLQKLIEFVNRDKTKRIRIQGYTDSRGNDESNRVLSLKRADSVRDALVAAGVDAKRISTEGMGEEQPIASNDSEDGRTKNRRVVVSLEAANR
jgi:outer membrane protein OmpA-like peptidoglycan-associated protein